MNFPIPNEHGVYSNDQAERLAIDFEMFQGAEIYLLQVEENEWAGAVHINVPNSGVGWGISKSFDTWKTYDEAFTWHKDYIRTWCEKELQRSDTTQAAKDMIEKIFDWLDSLAQMRLF